MNKLNKKGFTLVELLAVIVILSVLMLIALPSVLNIMNKAKDDAFRDEALSFIDAAEKQYVSEGQTDCVIYYYGDKTSLGKKIRLTTMKNKENYEAYIGVKSGANTTINIIDKNRSKFITSFTKDSSDEEAEIEDGISIPSLGCGKIT